MSSFPGSSPAFCRIPYGMPQKAGEELGNELVQSLVYVANVHECTDVSWFSTVLEVQVGSQPNAPPPSVEYP